MRDGFLDEASELNGARRVSGERRERVGGVGRENTPRESGLRRCRVRTFRR